MQPLIHGVLCLLLSCCFQDAEARSYISNLTVTNGGQWGEWGEKEFCPSGYANGFSLKAEPSQGVGVQHDDTALNGIRLYCTDGSSIESTVGPWGQWTVEKKCLKNNLIAFSLSVDPPQGEGDDTAVNNIYFRCSDGEPLVGNAVMFAAFGRQSNVCSSGAICGIQTKMEINQDKGDDTALNDVMFFCCE